MTLPEGELINLSGRTLSGVLSLVGREVVIRSAALVGSIVVARKLSPAEFGLFAIAYFVVNIFAIFAELGLGAAFIRRPAPVSRGELDALFTLQLVLVGALGLVLFLLAPWIASAYRAPEVVWLVRALSVSLLLISLRSAPLVAAEKALNYRPIALSDGLRHLVFWSVGIVMILAGYGIWSLILAVIVSSGVATGSLFAQCRWVPRLNFHWGPIKDSLPFAAVYQSQSVSHFLKDTMVPSVGGLLYSSGSVGYLMWALQLAQVPLLLTHLVGRVNYPALARLQADPEAFSDMLVSVLKWTCRVSFPLFAVLVAMAPQIVQFIYGPRWAPALIALYIFSLNMVLSVGTGVLMPALYSAGWASSGLRISIVWTVITWAGAIALAKLGVGFEGMAIAYAVGSACALVLIVARLGRYRSVDAVSVMRVVFLPTIGGVLLLMLTKLLAGTLHNWWGVVVLGLGSVALGILFNIWPDRVRASTAIRQSLRRISLDRPMAEAG